MPAKISNEVRSEIIELRKAGMEIKQIARKFGVSGAFVTGVIGSKKIGRPRISAEAKFERFTAKVGDCVIWTGGKNRQGYGVISTIEGGRRISRRAHRVSYEMANGPIPNGSHILHSCDNPSCVNPKHLRVGTHQENMDDKVRRSRQSMGERHASKLTQDEVIEIRRLASEGNAHQAIAEIYNVSQPLISAIVRRAIWKGVA